MVIRVIALIIFLSFWTLLEQLVKILQSDNKKRPARMQNKDAIPKETFFEETKALHKYAFSRTLWPELKLNKKLYIGLYILFMLLTPIFGDIKALLVAVVLSIAWSILLRVLLKQKRDNELNIINKFLQFKKKYMGLIDPTVTIRNYQSEFQIKWDDTNEYPESIKWFISPSFEKKNKIQFMQSLSENLGKGKFFYAPDEDWEDDMQITTTRKSFDNPKLNEFIENCMLLKSKWIGKVYPQTGTYTYEYEFTIDGYDSGGYPNKITLKLPIGVDNSNEMALLSAFSKELGAGRQWELDSANGWDFINHNLHLILLDPLPTKAPWSNDYIFNERISPYYFPLGLSSKGGVVIHNSETNQDERVIGYDPVGEQWKLMGKLGIRETGVQPPSMLNAPQVIGAGKTGGGKSVLLRNIENGCLLRPENWLLMIVDLKRVEGSKFLKFGVPVGTTHEDAASILTYAQKIMMDRYEEMVQRDVVNYMDIPESERTQAIMVIVDEAGELLSPIKAGKEDEQGQMNAQYQAQCTQAIESIYRLGRAAMVHVQVWSQRVALDQGITMVMRNNVSARMCAGPLDPTLSTMVFNTGLGTLVPRSPRGRIGLSLNDEEFIAQGFFADDYFLRDYLEEKYGKGNINVYNNQSMVKLDEVIHSKSDDIIEEMSEDEYEELLSLANAK